MPRMYLPYAGVSRQLSMILQQSQRAVRGQGQQEIASLYAMNTFNVQYTKQAAGRMVFKQHKMRQRKHEKWHQDHEHAQAQGFPCMDKEMNVIQASVLIAALGFFLYNKSSDAIPHADEGVNMVEIAFAADLKEGEMKELKVGDGERDKVLVSRVKGKLHAIGAYCSHFGFPLSKGALYDDKVMCPLHAAGFSVTTGAIDSAPGMDGVPAYEIVEVDNKHYVKVPEGPIQQKSTFPMVKRDPADERNFVIVGGGAAGLNAAETLRQSGYTGKITMINPGKALPYDRTLLTKTLPTGDASKFELRNKEFLENAGIDVVNNKLYAIHPDKKKVVLARGKPMSYDKLLIASGGTPGVPPIPGLRGPKNVHLLRTAAQQGAIKEELAKAKQSIVIIGSGFLGSEAAASIKMHYKDALDVHMIGLEEYPLEIALGKEVGKLYKQQHEEAGIKLHLGAGIKEVTHDGEGNANGVLLSDGTLIPAELIIVGTGVKPATEFLARNETGIKTDKMGAIICDPFLQSSVQDIYAAGDVCSYPYWQTGNQTRIEHWIHAQDQGSHAAFNMLNKFVPYGNTPFFWTRHYNKSLQYVGNGVGAEEVHIDGDVMKHNFLAYYIKGDKILAISGMGRADDILAYTQAFNNNKLPTASQVKSGAVTAASLMKELKAAGVGGCSRANCCQKKSK